MLKAIALVKSRLLDQQNKSEPGGESGFPREKFAVSAPNSLKIHESKALKAPKSGDSIFRQTHRLTAPAGFGWGFFVWLLDAPLGREFPKATKLIKSGVEDLSGSLKFGLLTLENFKRRSLLDTLKE